MNEKMNEKQKLGQILKEMGLVDEGQIGVALVFQKENHLLIGEALCELGYVKEENVLWALAQQWELAYLHIETDKLQPEVVRLIPRDFAFKNGVLPLYQIGDEMAVAISSPQVIPKVEKLKNLLKGLSKVQFSFSLCSIGEIESALSTIFGEKTTQSSPVESVDVKTAPTGETLLEEIVEKALDLNISALYFSFSPLGFKAQGASPHGFILLRELNREEGELIQNLVENEGSSLLLTLGDRKVLYNIWSHQSPLGKTFYLQQLHPLPSFAGREDLLSSLEPIRKGIVLFCGDRKICELALVSYVQHLIQKGKTAVAVTPHSLYPIPEITWFKKLYFKRNLTPILDFRPQIIYFDITQQTDKLDLILDLALQGHLCVLGSYKPTLSHLVKRGLFSKESRWNLLLQRIVEMWSLPLLCPDCKAKTRELPSNVAPIAEKLIDLWEGVEFFFPRSCKKCGQYDGYAKEEVLLGEIFPSSELEALLSTPKENVGEIWNRYKLLSPLLEKFREKIQNGEVFFFEAMRLWL